MHAESDGVYAPLEVFPGSLPKPFLVLERVTEHSQTRLSARMMPAGKRGPAAWELLEAMGQAACLHQRLLCGWKRQAMVLAYPRMEFGAFGEFGLPDVEESEVGGPGTEGPASGAVGERSGPLVHVELVARATSAAAYGARVEDFADGDKRLLCLGELKVGLMDWPGKDAGCAEARRESSRERSMEMWRCVLQRR